MGFSEQVEHNFTLQRETLCFFIGCPYKSEGQIGDKTTNTWHYMDQ